MLIFLRFGLLYKLENLNKNYKTGFPSPSCIEAPTQLHSKNSIFQYRSSRVFYARECSWSQHCRKLKIKIICVFLEGTAVKDNIMFEIPASPHFIFSAAPPIVVEYQNSRKSAFTLRETLQCVVSRDQPISSSSYHERLRQKVIPTIILQARAQCMRNLYYTNFSLSVHPCKTGNS